jgi:hypothetical protein
MESDHISTIWDWATTESVRDVKVLLRFTNFYQWFPRKYAMVTTPISGQLRKAETSRMTKKLKWKWTRDAELAFQKLNTAVTDAPILNHFNPGMPIIL